MTPSLARFPASRRVLPAVVGLLVISALLPERFTRWLGWFSDPARAMIVPISAPMSKFSRWLLPASPRTNESEAIQELGRQVETLTQQHLRDEQEIGRLQRDMEEAFKVKNLNPSTPVRHLSAPVISTSSDLSSRLLTVRAGQNQGVEPNTVAVATGLQLLGKVVRTSPRTCDVQPITSRAAGTILGRIMVEGSGSRPLASLQPVGDGTLRGPVTEEGNTEVEIKRGAFVRLDDPDHWPHHAQMLVVGVVESVGPAPSQPLRREVTVRPTLVLERVSDVVLRVPDEPESTLEPVPASKSAEGSK